MFRINVCNYLFKIFFNIKSNLEMKRLVLMMTLIANACFVQGQGNNGWRFIELGISYDQHYLAAFASEQGAMDTLSHLVDLVNEIYDDYNVIFELKLAVKLNTYSTQPRPMRIYTSNYWNYRSDGCTTPDMVHHITGIGRLGGVFGQAGGGSASLCGIGPHTDSEVCSVSEFSYDLIKTANGIAHEIGHHLGMHHEELLTSFMYPETILTSTDNQLGAQNILNLNNRVNSASCVNVNNFGPDPFCESCDNDIKITNMSDRAYELDLRCYPDNQDTFDLSSAVTNICDRNRIYRVEIVYNDEHIEIVEKGDIFNDPIPYSGGIAGKYNKLLRSENVFLPKGGGDFVPFKIRIKDNGSGFYPNGTTSYTGAFVNVVYLFDHPAKIKDTYKGLEYYSSNSLALDFEFKYPYQMDKRGIPLVKASELKLPFDSLNFCFGDFVKEVYIDGDFDIDINQTYCNTNFYFGPNSRLILRDKKKLTLDSSTLTACEGRWEGIKLNPGTELETKNNTNIEHTTTAIEGNRAIVRLNKTNFKDNVTAVNLINSDVEDCTDIDISEGNYGIRLSNCSSVNLAKVQISKVKFIGIKADTTSLKLSGCQITGISNSGGTGIQAIGTGDVLKMDNDLGANTVSDWQIGINCLRNNMDISYVSFTNNFIGMHQSNSPGLKHHIKNNTFTNCSRGVITTNSTPVFKSNLKNNVFDNVDYGITISNALNPGTGWSILNNELTESGMAGIRLNNSSGNAIMDSYMESKGLAKSNLITINGGMKNSVCHNQLMNGTGMISEANQVKGIAMNGVAGYNVTCNEVQGGSYGFNFWAMGAGDFKHNASNQVHTGLYCGLFPIDGNVVMGRQEHKFNIWNNSAHTVGAKHLSSNIPLIHRSQFTVIDNPNLGQYWPNPIIPNDKEWFKKDSTNITPRDCSNYDEQWRPTGGTETNTSNTMLADQRTQLTLSHNPGEDAASPENNVNTTEDVCGNAYVMSEELVTNIIDKAIPFDRYEPEILAHSYWQLYKLVQSNNTMDYVNYPGVAQFMSDHALTLGVLYQAERTLAGVNHYTVSGAYFNNLANQSTQTYSTVTDSIYRAMYSDERALHILDIQNTLISLQALSITEIPWTFTKDLLIISGKALINDSLTALDLNRLEEIAVQCPLYGGDAVYGARGMLEAYNIYQEYDDSVLCQPIAYRTSIMYKLSGISVVPNPAADRIRVIGQYITNVELMAPDGQMMDAVQRKGVSEVEMDISRLPAGIYMVNVTYGEDHKSETKKVVIIR